MGPGDSALGDLAVSSLASGFALVLLVGADVGALGCAGSGKGAKSLPAADVSIVICLVSVGRRRLYTTGEHLTAIDGFLCPGRCATGGLLSPARL